MGVHHRRPDGQMGRQQGMSRLSRLSDWKWKVERNCFFNNLLTLTKFRKLAPPSARPSSPLPPARPQRWNPPLRRKAAAAAHLA